MGVGLSKGNTVAAAADIGAGERRVGFQLDRGRALGATAVQDTKHNNTHTPNAQPNQKELGHGTGILRDEPE